MLKYNALEYDLEQRMVNIMINFDLHLSNKNHLVDIDFYTKRTLK